MNKEQRKAQKETEKTIEIERLKLREKEMRDFVYSFSAKKGKNKLFELLKWIFTGIFMGSSDAIPGYSGGTTLALIGFFKRLVILSRCVFIPSFGIKRLEALAFLIPFALGWVVGVFGIAKATEALASNGMGLELLFFFAAFVIFAIPIYLRTMKRDEISSKKVLSKPKKSIITIIGFVVVVAAAIVVLIVDGGAPFHGVNESMQEHIYKLSGWWKLVLVAFFAGMITLLPGGSGAIIQLLSGMYDKIHWTIMAHANENIIALIIFAFSTFLGMLTMIFIMSWFLARKERELEFLSLGMLFASPIAILIVPESSLWENLQNETHIIGVVVSIILGATFGGSINYYTKYKRSRN